MDKYGLLLVVGVSFLLLFTGCDAIEKYVLKPKEVHVDPDPEPEHPWQPDTSKKAEIAGRVLDAGTGLGLSGVTLTAEYTMPCTGSSCQPYHESVSVVSGRDGSFVLALYENFWDVSLQKQGYHSQTVHYAAEEIAKNLSVVYQLNKGELRNFTGFVRDQGSRIIIDKGDSDYVVSLDGKGKRFEFLVVVNDPESETYKRLQLFKNKQINFSAYFFVTENDVGQVDLVSFQMKE